MGVFTFAAVMGARKHVKKGNQQALDAMSPEERARVASAEGDRVAVGFAIWFAFIPIGLLVSLVQGEFSDLWLGGVGGFLFGLLVLAPMFGMGAFFSLVVWLVVHWYIGIPVWIFAMYQLVKRF